MVNIRIADVDIGVSGLHWYNLHTSYLQSQNDPKVFCDVALWMEHVKGPAPDGIEQGRLDRENNTLHLTMVCDEKGEDKFSHIYVRRYLAFLAGFYSQRYWFVHGAGFTLEDGRGVMLIGRSGSGKSTLTSLFAEAKTIDDDLLLVGRDEMCRPSKHTSRRSLDGRTESIYDSHLISKIDYVFVLNHEKDPSYVKEIDPSDISPEDLFDDRLPISLFDIYKSQLLIPLAAPVFVLGTHSRSPKSKQTILSVIGDRKK